MARAEIRPATEDDVPIILSLIRELAEYERLSHEVVATEGLLRESLFGERRGAEVLIACCKGAPAGFALFFHSFSTFLGRPGIYLGSLREAGVSWHGGRTRPVDSPGEAGEGAWVRAA